MIQQTEFSRKVAKSLKNCSFLCGFASLREKEWLSINVRSHLAAIEQPKLAIFVFLQRHH